MDPEAEESPYERIRYKPAVRGSNKFFQREKRRRKEAAQKAGVRLEELNENERESILEKGWKIIVDYLDELESSEDLDSFCSLLDQMCDKINGLGYNLGEGVRTSTIFKARNQISDYLHVAGRTDLVINMFQEAEKASSINEYGIWIEENVLIEFPGKEQEYFEKARDYFVQDVRDDDTRRQKI
jgi:hypothetical protein